jgi:acetate kinase
VAALSGDVLVVNAGSTSLKLSVVAEDESSRTVESLEDAPPVVAVAHRIVHGGSRFHEPILLDDDVVAALETLVELAPLHMRPALAAVGSARRTLPGVPHVAVFDTAFHRTIPERASTYALPRAWRERGIRRYGFHGLAAAWAAEQVPVARLVFCHLGGGCSVTAIRDGRSVDTTMGFTPLEGVPMGTRPGSVDPGALLYLLRRGLALDDLEDGLEHASGLRGLAGTDDVAALLAAETPEAELALDVFAYRVAQAAGAMAVALGGVDAVAFSGGIGEHATEVRERIVAQLAHLRPFDVRVVPAREDVVAARYVKTICPPPASS